MRNHIRMNLIKNIKIPIKIFELRLLSPAENLVFYLSHKLFLKQCEIAFLTKRNPRTVWTTLIRAENKLKAVKKPIPFHEENKKTKELIKEMVV